MTTSFRKFSIYCLLSVLLCCSLSCESVAECMLSQVSTHLPEQTLDEATMTQPYSQSIDAFMKHTPSAGYTISDIEVTGLPDGLNYETSGMTILLTGTPANAGDYDCTVKIWVESNSAVDEGEDICRNSANHTYRIKVNWHN